MAKNEELIQEILGQYRNRGAYTPKTSAENKARAEDEVRAYYDQLRLGAQQQQERADLALQQQRAGLQDTYDRQREASAQEYRQRYSQADRQMLSRGMQRSSYGAQVLANIGQQGAEAQQKIWEAQGAAEGNIDAQRAQLSQQLAAQLRQYDASKAADVLKRSRELDDQEYERAQADQARRDQTGMQLANMMRQAERDQVSDEQFEKQFGLSKQQFEAQLANQQWQQQRTEARDKAADEQWAKQFGLSQKELEANLANQQWQQQRTEARDKAADEQWAKQFGLSQRELEAQLDNQAWQRAYQEARAKVSDEQWAAQFGLNKQQLEAALAEQIYKREYQEGRDKVSDQQWQQNYDLNSKKFEADLEQQKYARQYQAQRDRVADSQWQKNYELNAAKAGINVGGSGSGTGGRVGTSGQSYSNYDQYVTDIMNKQIQNNIYAKAAKAKAASGAGLNTGAQTTSPASNSYDAFMAAMNGGTAASSSVASPAAGQTSPASLQKSFVRKIVEKIVEKDVRSK